MSIWKNGGKKDGKALRNFHLKAKNLIIMITEEKWQFGCERFGLQTAAKST